MSIEIVRGDITRLEVDAIVNAANSGLCGGGGVDGAIHRAAGPELLAECRTLGGCPTGDAKVTGGHRLPARWIIHAVGPIWRGGRQDEAALLGRAWRRCLELGAEIGAKSVAFPAISCGIYGFPIALAAEISVAEVVAWQAEHARPERVILCAFDSDVAAAWRAALSQAALVGGRPPDP